MSQPFLLFIVKEYTNMTEPQGAQIQMCVLSGDLSLTINETLKRLSLLPT